nr:NADH dehydrogenase subunit 5 [Carrikerella sp.]
MSLCKISFLMLMSIFLITLSISLLCIMNDNVIFIEWELTSINSSLIVMTILVDWMSMLFMSFVTLISSLVILYSEGYMENEQNMSRFIFLVLLFVLSMVFLIISPNLISILLGWDGLGLVSYCLVIFYQNEKSYNAGMLTALSNRVGDVALLMAISWMLSFGSWNYYVFYLSNMIVNEEIMMIISWLIVLAGMTKSAQIPFSAWLPAAMAAPTPVSALVHSSTLVTAGVYLLIRFSNVFSVELMNFMLVISVLTMFMSGLGANYEFDLKKIIALSTLSQLGLMMGILSLGLKELAFFHLLIHALFKALLFMCAGMVIHNLNNLQDIRMMGSFITFFPLTSSCFMVSNFALCGMPFLAGFYSKDLILEMMSLSSLNLWVYMLFFISTGLTVCYSFRLFFYVLWGDMNFMSLSKFMEGNWMMISSMIGLAIFGIIGGSLLSWLIISSPYLVCLPLSMKMMTLIVSGLGLWFGMILFDKFSINYLYMFKFYEINLFMSSMWCMPKIFTKGVSMIPMNLGLYSSKFMDMGWSEYLGAQNINYFLMSLSYLNQWFHKNELKMFLVFFIMILFLGLMIL